MNTAMSIEPKYLKVVAVTSHNLVLLVVGDDENSKSTFENTFENTFESDPKVPQESVIHHYRNRNGRNKINLKHVSDYIAI